MPPGFQSRCLIPLLFLLLTGCSEFDALNATVPAFGYDRQRAVPYGPDPRQTLDVYTPRAVGPAAGRPVVVFFYGGSWRNGTKEDYRFAAQALVSRGFVAVLPDYRVFPAVTFPAFVDDGARATRWAYDNAARFGGDPARLFLMGHSAGAHIVALLATDPHYLAAAGVPPAAVRGAIAMSGPYQFTPRPDDAPVFGRAPGAPTDPAAQAITFADRPGPPMLLLHGSQDDVIGAGNATALAAALTAHGRQAQLILYPRLGHPAVVLALAFPFRWLAPVLDNAATFIRAH